MQLMNSEWKTVTLGDVCEIYRGGSPRPIKNYITSDPSGVNWIKIGDVSPDGKYINRTAEKILPSGIKHSRLVERGDFLLSNSMSFGRPYICQIDGCIHDGWLVLKKISNSFVPDYLYYILRSPNVSVQFDQLAKGSTVRNLNRDSAAKVLVPVPPLSEQERIIRILDAAFEKIDTIQRNAERNLANAKDLFQQVVDKEMTPKNDWIRVKIKDFSEIKIGPFGSLLHKSDYVEKGIPIVNPCHMRNNTIDSYIPQQISLSKAEELSSYSLRENDLVFARRGDIGRCALIGPHEAGYLCGTGSLFVRIKNRVLAPFLFWIAQNSSFVSALEKTSTGTTMSSINVDSVSEMVISFPPIEKQKSILKSLFDAQAMCNKLEMNNIQVRDTCNELKQQILTKAFNGEL